MITTFSWDEGDVFISSAVIFCANLLRTGMMRATGTSCEFPMCRHVICRMQLSFMVKL